MLVLSRSEVEELLDLDELMDALARAHEELSAGKASLPPRIAAMTAGGLLGAMPAYLPSAGLGCKLVTLFPHNTDRPTHQAAIVLFDPENGSPIALMDGTYITATRTAAAAALAAKLLARDDARVLAILGTGVQSHAAQEMFPRARDFVEVRVAGRGEFEDAVRGADVVHACTHSPEPVVLRDWLAPGAHVGSVGLNPAGLGARSGARPRRDDRRRVARVVVRAAARGRAGARGRRSGVRGRARRGRSGNASGRTSADELTLYKSVGVAVQDLAAAALVLAAAQDRA